MTDGPITLGELAIVWAIALPFAGVAGIVAWVAHRIGQPRSSAGRPGGEHRPRRASTIVVSPEDLQR